MKKDKKAPFVILKALDEEYLGQRLPVSEWVRTRLLKTLAMWLADPDKGPNWLRQNRARLLEESKIIEEEKVMLLP